MLVEMFVIKSISRESSVWMEANLMLCRFERTQPASVETMRCRARMVVMLRMVGSSSRHNDTYNNWDSMDGTSNHPMDG